MLIITRKQTEGIQIEGPCRIVVLGVRGGNVKLGIEAERSVKVRRDELGASGAEDSRCCMVCGAGSGDEPLLPDGWSFTRYSIVFAEKVGDDRITQGVAAFFCDRCTNRLGLEEARNYGENVN